MGKRELVLISLFVVVGIVVYQLTAPPPPPGSDVSVGGIFQRLKRSVQGARASASSDATQTLAVPADVRQVRISLPRASDLTITGVDGDTIVAETHVSARGFDDAEAKAAADAVKLKLEASADAAVVSSIWNVNRGGGSAFVTQAVIDLKIPRRLSVSLEPHIGLLTITDTGAVEAKGSRGETKILRANGAVQLTQSNGPLEVANAASLKLTTRGGRADISHIAGKVTIEAVSSRLKLADVAGPIEIESRNTDTALENVAAMKPPLRYNATGGELRIDGLRTEARIDGRNTSIDVRIDAAAPITIYNLGEIRVTPPAGGYTLDALASEGRIFSEESGVAASDGPDARANVKVRGGGATLTLRATRGRIELRKPAGK